MRKYPQDSSRAAARVVVLTIVADGDVDKAEFALLDELAVHEQLLSSNQLAWADNCPVDDPVSMRASALTNAPRQVHQKFLGQTRQVALEYDHSSIEPER